MWVARVLTAKIITSRDPMFLKAAYAVPSAVLIDHDGYVEAGERFVIKSPKTWDVFTMTPSRAHRKVGSYNTIHAALHIAIR
jgi:hypothetical protein